MRKVFREKLLPLILTLILMMTLLSIFTPPALAEDTTLLTVDFEIDGAGYTVTGGQTATADDWWARTDGTTVSADVAFTGKQGTYYFYGEDTDNGRTTDDPVYVTLDPVDVTGYTDLHVKILVAANDDATSSYEGTEYLKVQYAFDGGEFITRAQYIAALYNTCLTEDTNADGFIDGANISTVFTEYTYSIPFSGTNLQIRIAANSNSGREEVGFDNIRITGTAGSDTTPPTLSGTSVSNVSASGATLNFTSDEFGTYYYLVYASGDPAPDAETVKAQGAAAAKKTGAASDSANAVSVSGLFASTAYKAYVIVEDYAGNTSAVYETSFTTSAAGIADVWDGSADIVWYRENPTATSFEIKTAEELAGLALLVDEGVNNFNGSTIALLLDLDLDERQWTPIGLSSTNSFQGSFDGNQHMISSLVIGTSASPVTGMQSVGLFGYCGTNDVSISISNLGVEDVSICAQYSSSYSKIGGLIGYINGTVSNCYAVGLIESRSDDSYIGGLIGQLNPGSVTKCYADVDITGTGSTSTSDVNTTLYTLAGGLIGRAANSSACTITNCYATGDVTCGVSARVGGLVGHWGTAGYNVCTITNSYATGTVSAQAGTYTLVGGFAGNLVAGSIDYGYWNSSAAAAGVGYNYGTTGPTSKTYTEMQHADFVTLLNANAGGTVWKTDSDATNYGYPPIIGVGAGVDSNAAPVASSVQVSGTAAYGQTLTGSYTYSDADNDAEGTSILTWYRADDASGTNRAEINGETAETYTLAAADIGKYIGFEVTPVAQTGITPGTAVIAYTASAVEKADCETSTGTTPVLEGKTDTTVTLTSVTGYQYIRVANGADVSTGTWQDGNAFTGLSPNTAYDFYQRVKETETRKPSAVSDVLDVTTFDRPTVTDGNISIGGASGTGGAFIIGDTVTATWDNTASGDNNSGISAVTVNFSQFGGDSAVSASNSSGTWTAAYTITAGAIDATNRNVSLTAIGDGGIATTTADTTNATVDNTVPTVTSVSVPANGTYITGQNLNFTVNFNENITINTGGGTPRIAITVGASTVYASYLSGSGTSALAFRYTVVSGRLDTDGIALGTLSANGGTMRDDAGNNANVTLNSVGSTAGVLVDAVAPTVTSVSVPDNGTYTAGHNLDFTVNFAENVTVNTGGGTPRIALTVGASTVYANYVSGSGTSAHLYRYTVASGQLDSDGIAVGTLSANGGTMRDDAGNDANLTLNSVGSTTGVLVDAVAPTVTSVSVPANGTYTGGQNLNFTVNFSENVTLTTGGGTPYLTLTVGSSAVNAEYLSGSGTNALVFRYTVDLADDDVDGIAVGTLFLNGGTMRDAAGNNANLTLNSIGSTTGVLVDAVVPAVTSVSVPANGTYIAGQNLNFTVNFSENITVNTTGGTPRIALTVGASTVYANYLSGSGTSALVFRYTVESGRLDGDGIAVGMLSANGGTMRDAAGNDADLTLNSVGSTTSVLVDAVVPTVTSVSVPANGMYTAGQNLDFTINFTESVTVNTAGGEPYLVLTVGSSSVHAAYLSGTGTSALVFRYTVVSGEKDGDGIELASNISLGSGTMKDPAGNNASLTFTGSALTGVIVKDTQTITFGNPGAQNFGTSPTLDATSTSGLTVTFTSDTPDVCTITSAGVLTFLKAGTATISANQAGNNVYLPAATVTQSFTVNAIVPGAPTNITAAAGDTQATVSFSPPASNGGAAITTYTATSSPGGYTGSCAGTSDTITVTGLTNGTAYTFTVTATNSAGTGAASTASNSVTPGAPQTITFANPGAQDFGTSPTLSATSSSGLAVTFTSDTPDVCTITSTGVLTFLKAGTAAISANQGGNSAYLPAATVTQSFTVNAVVPGAPAIGIVTASDTQVVVSFTPPASKGGAEITSYTVTSSPGGITASGTSSPIIVTGLTNGTAYTFTVTATNSAGTGAASPASGSVTPKASQTIAFANPGARNFGTSPTLTATSSAGLPVTFTSDTPDVCTITSDGVLTFLKVGTATISADQAGNSEYFPAATVSRSFTVSAVVPGAPTAVTATTGNGWATVSFTPPVFNGGAEITSYTVTSSPGGITASGTSSPIIVTGLTNGTAYTFTVTATNSAGTGAASSKSNRVTPKTTVASTPASTVSPTPAPTPSATIPTAPSSTPSAAPSATVTPIPMPTATQAPAETMGSDTRTITGTLFDSNGNPMAGYVVELHSDPMTTVTDADGRYTFHDVDYTNHELIVKTSEGEKIAEFELVFTEGEEFGTDVTNEGVNITYTRSTETVDIAVKLIPDQSGATIAEVSGSDNPQMSDTHGGAGSVFWWIGGGVLAVMLITWLIIILLKKKKQDRKELN